MALRHGITYEELGQAITYVTKLVGSGDFLLATTLLLADRTIEVSFGRAYAHPEKDGASTWMATGPGYVPGAPQIDNPSVLPMAPDEPGDTLFVSGVLRSTAGKPLPGAVIDLWQTTADGRYAGLTPEQAGPLEGPDVVDFDLPKYHLRGRSSRMPRAATSTGPSCRAACSTTSCTCWDGPTHARGTSTPTSPMKTITC
ncbi:hypothetical protein ACF090_22715 [Streptomyces sp. NPDC014892]|uniref:dioxygenase family protein n=1 Tax=Streptomyces sp. NPDC014892 TaxID=3364930 RepID=UPI0037002326